MTTFADESQADAPRSASPTSAADRLRFALRQAASLGGCLVIGGLVVARLRPETATPRDIVATPFIWAAVVWAVLLLFAALAFEDSQIRRLERVPLIVGGAAGVLVFVVGLARFSAGSAASRIVYLFGNAMGAAVFWWGVAGIALLLWVAASRE